jgi:hypothetical protein
MEEMEEYYNQFKNYYLSNLEIINILTSDNIKNYNDDWSDKLFYAIPADFIEDWKKQFDFNDICKTMNLNKDIKIIDEQKDKIIELMKKNKGLQKSKNLDIYEIHSSLKKSINYDEVSPFTKFYLINKNAWNSFDKKEDLIKKAKIDVRKGYRKIMIKTHKNNYFTIFYLSKNTKEVDPTTLTKCLNKTIINIENQEKEWIEDVIRFDIFDWFKIIDYKEDENNKEYKYKDYDFIIENENMNKLSFNEGSIISNKTSKNDAKEDIGILKKLHINNIMVIKVKFSSFIIASMYSLSQIKGLYNYYQKNKKEKFLYASKILKLFQEFLDKLWKENEEGAKFTPKEFMEHLNRKDKKTFDFKIEKEPIVFLDYIIKELNEKLKNKDDELKQEIINSQKALDNDKNFSKFYELYIQKHNSIMSKLFNGIFHIKNECKTCGKFEDYKIFNHIIIDINEYLDYHNKSDNSLIDYYLDDLIDFYFDVELDLKNERNTTKCPKCKQDNNITKKDQKTIIIFPEILIFSINWGNFDPKGLPYEENKLIFEENEKIDMSKYSFNKINKDKIEYKFRSVINYPVINDKNRDNKAFKKFITISRHFEDQKIYSYQPSGATNEIRYFNRRSFIPFVLFYEKI